MGNKYVKYPLSTEDGRAIILTYILGFIVFIPILVGLIMNVLNIDSKLIQTFATYATTTCILIVLARNLLKKECKPRALDVIASIFLGMVALLVINIVIGTFIQMFFSLETSANQREITKIQTINPVFYLVIVAIFAPIVEEIVFRGVIFRRIRERKGFVVAALLSGFAFGFIHVIDSIYLGDFADLVYVLLYGGLGIVFAFTYEYTGSIYACIILHSIYNAYAFITTFM